MIPKCKCYQETDRYKPYSDGECWGTMEREPCNCRGDKSKCDFYEQETSTEDKEDKTENFTLGNKIATYPIDMDKIMTKHIVTPKNGVDIHKIIDDAIVKKDRVVHIFITDNTTSVDVMPYEGGNPRWINKGVLGYECPECHAMSKWPTLYCPNCGATLARPESEDANGDYIPPKRA